MSLMALNGCMPAVIDGASVPSYRSPASRRRTNPRCRPGWPNPTRPSAWNLVVYGQRDGNEPSEVVLLVFSDFAPKKCCSFKRCMSPRAVSDCRSSREVGESGQWFGSAITATRGVKAEKSFGIIEKRDETNGPIADSSSDPAGAPTLSRRELTVDRRPGNKGRWCLEASSLNFPGVRPGQEATHGP